MTELTSARESAMNILEQLKRTLSVRRIQRYWRAREIRINDLFEKERMISIRNKDENTIIIPEDHIDPCISIPVKWTCGLYKSHAIIPDWNTMKLSPRKQPKISFGIYSKSRNNMGKNKHEETILVDAVEKESTNFYKVIFSWITAHSCEKNETFFLTRGKSWMKQPEKYKLLLDDTINTMKENKTFTLWGDRGKNMKLFPFLHEEILENLSLVFQLHLNLVKLERLKREQRKQRQDMTMVQSSSSYIHTTI